MFFKKFRKAAKKQQSISVREGSLLTQGFIHQGPNGAVLHFAMAVPEGDKYLLSTAEKADAAMKLNHLDSLVPLREALEYLDRFEMERISKKMEGGAATEFDDQGVNFREFAKSKRILIGHEATSRYHTRKVKAGFAAKHGGGA